MDWNAVIERNREALKRVLVALAAMAEAGCRGQFTFFPQRGARPQDLALAEKSKLSPAPTLPRHLHRAVLRLLRPAEAAVRRLVIVAARDVVVVPPAPSRPRKPKPDPKAAHAVLRGLGLAVVVPHNVPHPEVRGGAEPRRTARKIALPLFDPLRVPRPGRPRTVPAHVAPRILSFDGNAPHRLPPPPSPDDPIDAKRLGLRLAALASALDDLAGHARRFARWKVARDAAGAQNRRSDAGRSRRLTSLRPGRLPGLNAADRRRPSHEVHEILADLQYFALKALQPPDTS